MNEVEDEFDSNEYDEKEKELERLLESVKAKRERAKRLWTNHIKPLSHDERWELHRMLSHYLEIE